MSCHSQYAEEVYFLKAVNCIFFFYFFFLLDLAAGVGIRAELKFTEYNFFSSICSHIERLKVLINVYNSIDIFMIFIKPKFLESRTFISIFYILYF